LHGDLPMAVHGRGGRRVRCPPSVPRHSILTKCEFPGESGGRGVDEYEGVEGLILGGGGEAAAGHEVVEEGFDVGGAGRSAGCRHVRSGARQKARNWRIRLE
jgi:hypothetical protein